MCTVDSLSVLVRISLLGSLFIYQWCTWGMYILVLMALSVRPHIHIFHAVATHSPLAVFLHHMRQLSGMNN